MAELDEEFTVFVTRRVNQALLNNGETMYNIMAKEAEAGNVTLRYKGGKYQDMDFLGP